MPHNVIFFKYAAGNLPILFSHESTPFCEIIKWRQQSKLGTPYSQGM